MIPNETDKKSKARIFWKCCQAWSLSLTGQLTMLMILVLRTVWGMWNWRDMTYGDTTGYFYTAAGMNRGEATSLVFSPLYEAYYSWFIAWFPNAFAATILHRIGILMLLSVALLLVARKLLPKGVAWLVAAWWLVLPINWNALYEVHLFGFIPLLLGCWLVGLRWRSLGLALGLASVWAGALLVRNEYALSVALLTLLALVYHWLRWRKSAQGWGPLAWRIWMLAVPSLVVLALSAAAWHRSWPSWAGLQAQFRARHTLNMAQVYPFSYQQRHPEWRSDPWQQGGSLMKEKFGKSLLSFSEAYQHNPSAIREHVLWHFYLTPAGIQLGLFNGHTGTDSPDFTPPRHQPVRAGILSALLLILFAAGFYCLWKRRARFKRFMKSRRMWSWLTLLCLLPPCFVAIVTQRPRPSYIFPLNFFLMALAGLCLYAVLRRLKWWRGFQAALPLFMVAIIVSASPTKTTAQIYEGQPFRMMYDRVLPFSDYLQGGKTFASHDYTSEIMNVINANQGRPHNLTLNGDMEQSAASFQEVLESKRVGTLYLSSLDLGQQGVRDWLASDDVKGWTILANHDRGPDFWMLLSRPLAAKPKTEKPKADKP